MTKYLITGFSGFVSKHFLDHLDSLHTSIEVLGLDINQPYFDLHAYKNISCQFKEANLLDRDQIDNIIFQYKPEYILHLASFSSVSYSWKNPVASFVNNTNIFLNLIEQVRELKLSCRILSIGSSEEYGNVTADQLPLREDAVLQPISPYAVARVAQEMLTKVFVDGYGLDIVLTRSFNHVGPEQKDVFVVSSFAKQLVAIKRSGAKSGKIITGDVSIIRDFVDVRDVVRAYYDLLQRGERGEIYNICSGKGIALRELIERMARILDIHVEIEINPDFVRPNDNKIIIGSYDKIKSAIGWQPDIHLDKTLEDILSYWLRN